MSIENLKTFGKLGRHLPPPPPTSRLHTVPASTPPSSGLDAVVHAT